jgi:hypothetical protein
MTHVEREIFIRKLIDQKSKEAEEIAKSRAEAEAKAKSAASRSKARSSRR